MNNPTSQSTETVEWWTTREGVLARSHTRPRGIQSKQSLNSIIMLLFYGHHSLVEAGLDQSMEPREKLLAELYWQKRNQTARTACAQVFSISCGTILRRMLIYAARTACGFMGIYFSFWIQILQIPRHDKAEEFAGGHYSNDNWH